MLGAIHRALNPKTRLGLNILWRYELDRKVLILPIAYGGVSEEP